MLLREEAAEHLTAFVHGTAENNAVGPGEIDVLENALLKRLFGGEVDGLNAGFRNAYHFAGLDLANVVSVEEIERAGFGSNEPRIKATGSSEFAKNERAEAARVTDRVEFILGQHEKRICAFNLIKRIADRAGKIARLRAGI